MEMNKQRLFREMFDNLYNFMNDKKWIGACHASTAVLYTLALRIGLNAYPCIGEVSENLGTFDHSWLEVDNKIYDIAIALPLKASWALGPVFDSIDISTNKMPNLKYGITYCGLGYQAEAISQISIYEYLSSCPNPDLIKLTIDIAKKSNIKITKPWIYRTLIDAYWYKCTEE